MNKRIEMVDCAYNDLTTATNFAGHPRDSIITQSASHTNESKAFEKSMKGTMKPSFDLHFLFMSLHKPNTTSRVDLYVRNPPCLLPTNIVCVPYSCALTMHSAHLPYELGTTRYAPQAGCVSISDMIVQKEKRIFYAYCTAAHVPH